MTPNFITGLALHIPTAVVNPAALWMDDLPAHRRGPGYATISVGPRQQAQGPIVSRLADGRVSIEAGGRILTGHTVTPRPVSRSLWARISGRS
ncbi:hypothetical protein [uncultured Paracoccus sp.]|uniref:hypothetical protein n=1 Tax=uncultured Paracoccus sp. TaxID=189685 RepID=UPI0025E5B9A0|nr:hypothetical protein [uncultured Paracoccus sp.]